jgi:hypothetical protein
LYRHHAGEQAIGLPLTCQVVLDASHDDRSTKVLHATLKFGGSKPVNVMYTIIQDPGLIVRNVVTDIDDSQVLFPALWMNPQINAEQGACSNFAPGLFKHLPNDRLFGRFARFDMTSGMVDYNAAGCMLLDDEETPFLFNYSRDCEISLINNAATLFVYMPS